MEPRHLCALVLLWAGVAVLLLAVVAFVVLPRPYARLHALTTATSLGLPLIALSTAVETGPGRAAVKLLFLAAFAAVGGSVTTMALAKAERTAGERERPRAPKGTP